MKMRSLELSLWFSSAGCIVGGGVDVDDMAVDVGEGLGCPGGKWTMRSSLDAVLEREAATQVRELMRKGIPKRGRDKTTQSRPC